MTLNGPNPSPRIGGGARGEGPQDLPRPSLGQRGGRGVGVVFLGHGSRRGTATDEGLTDLAARLQRRLGPTVPVIMSGWEFTQPGLSEAVERLVNQGAARILVQPFFLFDGKHVSEEIPEEVARLRHQWPGVAIEITGTLALDGRLIAVVRQRIGHALSGGCGRVPCACPPAEGRPGLGVMVVNRGSRPSYDPGDRLRTLTQCLEEVLGGRSPVRPAHAEYASPTIGEATGALVASGCHLVVVVPYLIFPGKVLYDNVAPAVERARLDHPEIDFRLSPTLGVDDRLVEIAAERLEQAGLALEGDS